MKHPIVKTVLLALGLGLVAQLPLAAESHLHKVPGAKAAHAGKASAAKPKAKAVAPQPVLVDINSASREELKKLPGIGDAEADRIIAGRPYLSKAHLQTHKVVSPLVFQGVRDLVVARQKDAQFGKVAGK